MERKLIPAAVVLLLAACSGGEKGVMKDQAELVIGGEDAAEAPASLYQMPTPNELFGLIKDLGGEGSSNALSRTSGADRLTSRKERAVNFGIYSTDLVYASTFGLNVEVVRYYLTTKKLGDELGLIAAFNDNDLTRLERNLSKGDSLEAISNSVYLKACQKLEEEEMGPVLAMVFAGGWIESMHLLIAHMDQQQEKRDLRVRIAEQKVAFEQLMAIMDLYEGDDDVRELRAQLDPLREIYDKLPTRVGPPPARPAAGRLVLIDDVGIELSPEAYHTLAATVSAVRSQLVHAEAPNRS